MNFITELERGIEEITGKPFSIEMTESAKRLKDELEKLDASVPCFLYFFVKEHSINGVPGLACVREKNNLFSLATKESFRKWYESLERNTMLKAKAARVLLRQLQAFSTKERYIHDVVEADIHPLLKMDELLRLEMVHPDMAEQCSKERSRYQEEALIVYVGNKFWSTYVPYFRKWLTELEEIPDVGAKGK